MQKNVCCKILGGADFWKRVYIIKIVYLNVLPSY